MANQWFKFYGAEYLSDPKMDRLTVQERSCWLTLLCMASQTNGIIKYLSIDGLLTKSGIHFDPYDSSQWDNAQNVLSNFEKYEMISINKNGFIEIKNWEKRQEHNLTVAERVAKSRAKKKSNVTINVTPVTRIKKDNVTSVTTEENRADVTHVTPKNRIEENRIDGEQGSQDIPILIKSFESFNPASKNFYGRKNQRDACQNLIDTYGFDRVKSVIEKTLPKTNKIPYFPSITTPVQLFDKWALLESKIRQYQSEKVAKDNKYKVI